MIEQENRIKEAFWNRHFIVAIFGYFFLFMSLTLFFIFPIFFEQFSASKSRIGLIMGVHSLTAIVSRPFFGRLIDVKGRKGVSLVGIAFLILVYPLFHLVRNAGLLPILLRALTGLGWGVSMTATIAICSDLVPLERLARSMGIIGIAGIVSVALGPLLAEEIVNRYGFGALFNTGVGFLVISFLCILFTPEVIRSNNSPDTQKQRSLSGFSLVSLALVASLPIAHGSVRGAVVYFIALFGKSIPLERIGPFFVAFSGAAILTRLFFGDLSDRYGRKSIIFPAVCMISLNLFLISQLRGPWLFILTGAIGGFGQGLIFPALSTYIIDFFGRENKGFALSLYLSFFDIGLGFGSVFFGWISDLFGYRNMYLSAGLVFFLAGLMFLWRAPTPGLDHSD